MQIYVAYGDGDVRPSAENNQRNLVVDSSEDK